MHKVCSDIKGKLLADHICKGKRFIGFSRPFDGRSEKYAKLEDSKLDLVESFVILVMIYLSLQIVK